MNIKKQILKNKGLTKKNWDFILSSNFQSRVFAPPRFGNSLELGS